LLFLLQGLTGILLRFIYVPSPDQAYDSILFIENNIFLGGLVRNLHHWGGIFFVIVTFLHFIRVFYSQAQKILQPWLSLPPLQSHLRLPKPFSGNFDGRFQYLCGYVLYFLPYYKFQGNVNSMPSPLNQIPIIDNTIYAIRNMVKSATINSRNFVLCFRLI